MGGATLALLLAPMLLWGCALRRAPACDVSNWSGAPDEQPVQEALFLALLRPACRAPAGQAAACVLLVDDPFLGLQRPAETVMSGVRSQFPNLSVATKAFDCSWRQGDGERYTVGPVLWHDQETVVARGVVQCGLLCGYACDYTLVKRGDRWVVEGPGRRCSEF